MDLRGAAGDDGGAAGGELVYDGDVHVPVDGEGERAGDGGGGHDEDVRVSGRFPVGAGLLHELEALLYAETVLLIDDDEAEILEVDGISSMRAWVPMASWVSPLRRCGCGLSRFTGFIERAGEEVRHGKACRWWGRPCPRGACGRRGNAGWRGFPWAP